MKYHNKVVTVSNYATEYLDETLYRYGQQGYVLTNVVMAKNNYNVEAMYLFFAKPIMDGKGVENG